MSDPADFHQVFSDLIRAAGIEKSKFPPFDSWAELRASYEKHNLPFDEVRDERYSEELNIALACLSIFHSYLSGLALCYFVRLSRAKRITPKNQAGFTLASGIAADVGAIALLCREGFDIQAKNLLRSLREKLDCLIAVQLNRRFAVEFVAAEGSDNANRFWHKRIARGKLKKFISERISKLSRKKVLLGDEWFERRESFERWVGEAVHPSHTTGLLSAFPDFGRTDVGSDDFGCFGAPSDSSISTIQSAMGLAYEITFMVRVRGLISEDDFEVDERDIYDSINRYEGFMCSCTAKSMFEPNLDIFKLLAYARGMILVKEEGVGQEVELKKYETEVLDILIDIISKVRGDFEERISQLEA